MVGDDPSRRQSAHPLQAARQVLRTTVENRRRQMDQPAVTREEVSGKEQIETRAQESAMALGMTRQMHHTQAAPVGKLASVSQWFVDRHRTVAKKRASTGLQCSTHAAGAAVRKLAADVRLLRGMGQHRSACQLLDLGQVAGVIEMSVSQEDGADVGPAEPDLLQNSPQQPHFAGKAGIDQDGLASASIVQQMKIAQETAYGIDAVHGIQRIEPGHRLRITATSFSVRPRAFFLKSRAAARDPYGCGNAEGGT